MERALEAKALIERIYRDGYNGGDEAVFDRCYAPSFVHHSKVLHDVAPGGEGEKQSMLRFRAAIPDVHFDVLQTVVDGDQVVARLRISGTAVAAFGAVLPGRFDGHVVAWFKVSSDGGALQVAEEWMFSDSARP